MSINFYDKFSFSIIFYLWIKFAVEAKVCSDAFPCVTLPKCGSDCRGKHPNFLNYTCLGIPPHNPTSVQCLCYYNPPSSSSIIHSKQVLLLLCPTMLNMVIFISMNKLLGHCDLVYRSFSIAILFFHIWGKINSTHNALDFEKIYITFCSKEWNNHMAK